MKQVEALADYEEEIAAASSPSLTERSAPCRSEGRAGGRAMSGGQLRRRIDPRVALAALALLNVAVFVSSSAFFEITLVGLDVLFMLWCRRPRLAAAWLGVYAAVLLLSIACILAGPALMPVGSCLIMLRRLFPTALFAAAMISTTYLGELAYALQSWGLSGRMTVAICVGLRFFPTIMREAKAVREAMLTRGIRLTPRTILTRPAAVLENFMVPYLHRISLVADELGDAVMARGVETTRKRTCYHPMRLAPADFVVLGTTAVLAAAAVAGKVLP